MKLTRKGFFATIGAALFGAKVAPAVVATPPAAPAFDVLTGFKIGHTITVRKPLRFVAGIGEPLQFHEDALADDIDREAIRYYNSLPRRAKRPHLFPFATRFDPARLPK